MKVYTAGRYDVKIEDGRFGQEITATATAGPVIGTFRVNVQSDGRVNFFDQHESINHQRHADKPGFDVSLTFTREDDGRTWKLDRRSGGYVRKSYYEAHDFLTMAPKTYAAAVIEAATEICGQLPQSVFDQAAREGFVRRVESARSAVNRLTQELAEAQAELDTAEGALALWDIR